MVLKKKKVDGSYLVHKPYTTHPSKPIADDPLKSIMCKDLRDRLHINKAIDKIDKSIKGTNTSLFRGKSSVKGLIKEFGTGLDNNYYNFNKAPLENPFSKYGVVLNNYKVKPRRKTHSAPAFTEFDKHMDLIQKIDTTLEENKLSRDTTGEAYDNSDRFPFPIEGQETRATGSTHTDYYTTNNLSSEFLLSEELKIDTYRDNLDLETTRTYKTDYVDTSRSYKSDSIDNLSFDFDSIIPDRRIIYNSIDEVLNRLYKYTKNIFFDRTYKHNSLRENDYEEGSSPTESKIRRAIIDQNPTLICENLMDRLDSLVTARLKYSKNPYSTDRFNSFDSFNHNSDIHSFDNYNDHQNANYNYNDIDSESEFRSNDHSGLYRDNDGFSYYQRHGNNKYNNDNKYDNINNYSNGYRDYSNKDNDTNINNNNRDHKDNNKYNYKSTYIHSHSHINTDYEETTLDMTPNKYLNNNNNSQQLEDTLLKVSTDSASRVIAKTRDNIAPLKPYDSNDDFMLTDSEDYAILETRFGRIIYSPKLQDDKYMYRFVVLTSEAQKAVEILSKSSPKKNFGIYSTSNGKRLLTEYEIIRELGIQMSSGWHHFFYFKNAQKELILRKPL